jgi:hypothetical protein
MCRPEMLQPLKIPMIAVAIIGRESTPTRIPHPAKASNYENFKKPKNIRPRAQYSRQPKTNRLSAYDLTQTVVWDDLVGRPRGFRSGLERAHCRTLYSSNGANPANAAPRQAGRTAAPSGGEGLKIRANPMVAYSIHKNLAYGTWHPDTLGTRHLSPGIWYLASGTWHPDTRHLPHVTWHLAPWPSALGT